jgi:hypothetical protein
MDTVILDGVTYQKASVAAKTFSYTSDYIGQLCRAKKIDARLVGRTWFVNPDSITAHKKAKFSKVPLNKKEDSETDVAIKIEPSRMKVESVINNKTAKFIDRLEATELPPQGTTRKLRVSYERDEESLIPSIERRELPRPKNLRVVPAGAQKLRVAGKKTTVNFKADDLPEISLSGKLKIKPITDAEDDEASGKTLENKAISPKSDSTRRKLKVRVCAGAKKTKVKVALSGQSFEDKVTSEIAIPKPIRIKDEKPYFTSVKKSEEVKFAPITIVEPVKPVQISFAVLASPLIATVLALVCVTVLFSTSATVVTDDSDYYSGIKIQAENLIDIFNLK